VATWSAYCLLTILGGGLAPGLPEPIAKTLNGERFEPWNKEKRAAWHDEAGRLAHSFAIDASVEFAHGFSGIGANYSQELFAWLCPHFDSDPARSDELQDFLNIIGRLIIYKYPASAKPYMQPDGIDIKPLARASRHVFADGDIRMFRALCRSFLVWKQKLKLAPCGAA
jgi:hypothetical protein